MDHDADADDEHQKERNPEGAGKGEGDQAQAEDARRQRNDPAQPENRRPGRQVHGSHKSPHAGRGHQEAQGMGATVQDIPGKGGHQDRIGNPHEARQGQEQENEPDRLELIGVPEPFRELLEDVGAFFRRGRRGQLHGKKRRDDGEIAQAVQEKTDPLSDQGDEDARHGGSEKSRPVEHGGVQGDGIAQVPLVVDHVNDKGLPRRDVQGIDAAQEQAQHDDVPDRHGTRQDEHRQRQGLRHGQRLGQDQGPVAVPAVRQDPREGRDDKRGKLARKTDHPQQEDRIGQAVDQPAQRDLLHPGADQGNALAREEQSVIPGLERSKDHPEGSGLFGSHSSRRYGRITILRAGRRSIRVHDGGRPLSKSQLMSVIR